MESSPVAPAARAAVFAAVCTLLAMAAHIPMSHQPVPLPVVAFGATFVFCFALVAASLGERGLGSIAALVGGSQIGLHVLFQVARPHAARPAPLPGTASMPGMADMPGVSSGSAPMGLTSAMTIAHVLAALAAAWWLRRGEAAVFAVARQAGAVLGVSWRLLVRWSHGAFPRRSSHPAMPAVAVGIWRPIAARFLRFVVARRGPPAAVYC